ncbi:MULTISPECIES: DUF2249 domain-containing protein [Roseateles]|uniref:Uncharacterized protein (DUF2249 family) n=1 Tax=Pelomonas aquatica TaxID=431058 RepID=A0ABU1Z446_9BURK|nr:MULTISPECIES: DUF2249 domain-containing protein [Roseateles]KQY81752.1 aminotransferase [Pelomonas sp. Root1444]MDR7295391.1 uncharacterized protein (DUF2249 family) [Pelomonas aquatica]
MSVQAAFPTLDVRTIAPRERHPTIFTMFRSLAANQAMELVNDHDPRPLYFQFQEQVPGKFAWDYVEVGPEVWRVRITRLATGHGNGQCCGSCGGA